MSDYLNIGSTPAEESCLPAGHPNARRECAIYCRQLEREFPEGNFRVKGFPHDFGTYYEVVAGLGTELEQEAAFEAEGEASPTWDEGAKVELSQLNNLRVRYDL